eukprot:scaffold1174_cov281-Chaetoceros_neogracile.AAC.7
MVHQDIPRHMNIKHHISHIFHLPSYLRRISNWYPSTLHFQSSELLSSFTKPQLVSKRLLTLYSHKSTLQHPEAVNKKEEKIASLDDSFLQELAADDLRKEEHQKKSAAKKKSKAESKARQRIAAQNKKHKTVVQDEDEDDGDLSTFVRKNK